MDIKLPEVSDHLHRLLILAIREALESKEKNKHGALLLSSGKIVGRGYNSLQPTCVSTSCYRHAEMSCLNINANNGRKKFKRFKLSRKQREEHKKGRRVRETMQVGSRRRPCRYYWQPNRDTRIKTMRSMYLRYASYRRL